MRADKNLHWKFLSLAEKRQQQKFPLNKRSVKNRDILR